MEEGREGEKGNEGSMGWGVQALLFSTLSTDCILINILSYLIEVAQSSLLYSLTYIIEPSYASPRRVNVSVYVHTVCVDNFRSLRRGDDVQFTEFVRYLIDKGLTRRRDDFHWRPMSEACLPCRINYTLVGHYETLAVDAAHVLRALGLSGTVQFPEVKVAKLRESENRTRRMFADIPSADVERLRQFYRDDFELFGYDPHTY